MKSSTFSRSIELAKLAAKVGLKELRSGDIKSRVDQAKLIAGSLSRLKGAAMKAGQLLSLDLNHYFPPEAIAILSQLQNAAEPVPFSRIRSVLETELSPAQRNQLTDFSEIPIGIASIGQVHRAVYQGQDVVLKIQYPGVADSIDSDLKILKSLAVSFCQLSGRKMNLEPLFKEFNSLLTQEVNYETEAALQKQYSLLVLRLKPQGDFEYRVPKIYEEMSTERVLTMSYERGVPLRSWIQSEPNMEMRIDIAHAILDLYFHEFFEWGLVQTDPNWGNFLVDEENHNLVLLDFGATRRYSREFIDAYKHLLTLAAAKDFTSLKQHAIQCGFIDPRESAAAFKVFEELITTAIAPFFVEDLGSTYFNFADINHSLRSQKVGKALSDELVYSPPPYDLVFLHRKLAGIYSILKSLEVRLDISGYWRQMTAKDPNNDAMARIK